jgi:hypothetical protein
MSENKNTTTEEDFKRAMWPTCFICRQKAEDVKKHIIEIHFKGSIDDALAKWLMDLDEDVEQIWRWLDMDKQTGHRKRRGRPF